MKQKITLVYENSYTDTPILGHQGTPRKMTIEVPGDITLPELLDQFDFFVRGIGFYPPEDSHLDYVDNETDEPKSKSNGKTE